MRDEARARGVRLLGDLAIFVAHESADVWAHPDIFLLDAEGNSTVVSGVPPDYFSATGQLWGTPLYDWAALRRTGYAWWIARARRAFALHDAIRLDHFRGFEAYWEVPGDARRRLRATGRPDPARRSSRRSRQALGEAPILAEDLGQITPEVHALRRQFGFPGMRVLQFAFGGRRTQRAPAAQLRARQRRLHRHARQRHDARLVRVGAEARAEPSRCAICTRTRRMSSPR